MTLIDTLDNLHIAVWNSKNRCHTTFRYQFMITDYYAATIEDCAVSAFDVPPSHVCTIKKGLIRTVHVSHSFKDEKEVYQRSEEFGILLTLSITKRNFHTSMLVHEWLK